MSATCRRQDEPPAGGPRTDILRVRALQNRQFVILADKHQGFNQHWIPVGKGYSAPCSEPKEDCPLCKEEMPTRWRAYIWVLELPGSSKFGHLELPAGAVKDLRVILGSGSWLGCRVDIRRAKGATSPLTCHFYERITSDTLQRVPLNRDVLPVLFDLWEKGKGCH